MTTTSAVEDEDSVAESRGESVQSIQSLLEARVCVIQHHDGGLMTTSRRGLVCIYVQEVCGYHGGLGLVCAVIKSSC